MRHCAESALARTLHLFFQLLRLLLQPIQRLFHLVDMLPAGSTHRFVQSTNQLLDLGGLSFQPLLLQPLRHLQRVVGSLQEWARWAR